MAPGQSSRAKATALSLRSRARRMRWRSRSHCSARWRWRSGRATPRCAPAWPSTRVKRSCAMKATTSAPRSAGVGGCGKTRLAVLLAELAADQFPDGIWFADLSLLSEDGDVALAVANGIDRLEEAHRPIVETILDHLRARRALLVVDNCEHVVAGC